jgi:hypothetical protein
MSQLANIFSAAGKAAFAEDEKTALPNAGQAGGESFDDVMSRAQSPSEANVAAQNRRLRTSIAGAQKRNPADSSQPLVPVKAGEDSPADSADSPATVKTKAGAKADDDHGKSADSLAQTGADVIVDASQNPAIPLPAPTLSAWLLNLSAPPAAAKSAANNPVATVVLPVGGAEKTGAAPVADVPGADAAVKPLVADAISQLKAGEPQKPAAVKNPPASKPDSQASGLSAAAPKLSVPAGAVAGDSVPQKSDVVPPGDAQPDNSIVLQNPAAESAALAPVKSHGTAVAKQDVPMKKTDQTNKVAGQAEKVLPGNMVSAAPEKVLPSRGLSVPVPAGGERLEANAANLAVAPDRAAGGITPPDEAAAVSNVSDRGAQALDRTHELVSLHALRLVDAKADLLQVVLKPGEGTKLSLELRQRGGVIEAQAVLQAGDFEHLKQHWPELQQRLEQRGIKLAPLTSDEKTATGSGSQGFQNQRNQPAEREPLLAGAFAGFVPAGAMTNLPAEPAGQAASSRGWQTWA